VEAVIAATKQSLARRREEISTEWQRARQTAVVLHDRARSRFEEVRSSLEAELGPLLGTSRFKVQEGRPDGAETHLVRHQVIQTARHLGYFANLREHGSWVRLVLEVSGGRTELLLAFTAVGHEYRGVIAASACVYRREWTAKGESQVSRLRPLVDEAFQINYGEEAKTVGERFDPWLDHVLAVGIEARRKDV
jgi:hypothetical protein